jgi:hypothetical protein
LRHTTEIIELEIPKNIHLNAFYWRNRLNVNFDFPEKINTPETARERATETAAYWQRIIMYPWA